MIMRIGELLVAAKLVSQKDVDAALERQLSSGGRLGDNLVELGILDREQLDAFLKRLPPEPTSIEETGLGENTLLELLMKIIYTSGASFVSDFIDFIKLPYPIVGALVHTLQSRHMLVAKGAHSLVDINSMQFTLSEEGRAMAIAAMEQSQYTGPAPVTLEAFANRAILQKISNETVDMADLKDAFRGLIISDSFVERLGPALNSGRAILLYGPPGNGKTSVALRLREVFNDLIYIPHAVMIEGQIMTVYDPRIHVLPAAKETRERQELGIVRREQHDARWVACQRPFVIAGGELTLQMLDLNYNSTSKFYEAPLHVKALGGCFVIDDFGRQLVSPTELLNRWILPLESRIDFLKFHTGTSFSLPFEEMIIFSTNLEPDDLMDQAFLRRIPYKLKVGSPSPERFRQIFVSAAKSAGLDATDEELDEIITKITEDKGMQLAAYIPKFIIDQVLAAGRFARTPPKFTPRSIQYALDNLRVERSDHPDAVSSRPD